MLKINLKNDKENPFEKVLITTLNDCLSLIINAPMHSGFYKLSLITLDSCRRWMILSAP